MSYSDLLTPRRDVLSEDGIEGIIDLANLQEKGRLEAKPADFFSLTYPTADIRRVIEALHRRFSGDRSAPGLFLFKDYLIAQKSPSIRYYRDSECPRCQKTFDWEIEPASLIAEPSLQVNSPTYSAGAGRTTTRWAFSPGKTVVCPWCQEEVAARPEKGKTERKKVPLAVLLCPHCEAVWQWRGEVPEEVSCPVCRKEYNPLVGNVPGKGKFLCASCGHTDDIIRSVRRLPEDQLLPMHPYALEGYCARCGGEKEEEEEEGDPDLWGGQKPRRRQQAKEMDHPCRITRNGGKFFKRMAPADLRRIEEAVQTWEREKERLPYPKQAVPNGQETHRLLEHHYCHWHQMFHPRQLLCLATLLEGIIQEEKRPLRNLLLLTLSSCTDTNNLFTRYMVSRDSQGGQTAQGVFARHDFQPKILFVNKMYGAWIRAVSGRLFDGLPLLPLE